jgi:cytochrome c biogenesis protein
MRTPPPIAPRNLDRMQAFSYETVDVAPADVSSHVSQELRRRGWRVRTGSDAAVDGDPGGIWVSAEKGYLRETGNLIFHLALVLILVAVAAGGLFGWRGNVIVKEGNGFSNTLTQYDAWGGGRLATADSIPPFSFTLDDFDVEFERSEAQRRTWRGGSGGTHRSQLPDIDCRGEGLLGGAWLRTILHRPRLLRRRRFR